MWLFGTKRKQPKGETAPPVVAAQRTATKIAFGKRDTVTVHSDADLIRREIGRLAAVLDATPNDSAGNQLKRSILNSRLIGLKHRAGQLEQLAQERAWNGAGRHALAIVITLGIGAACTQVINLVTDPAGKVKLVRMAAR